jgi:hypothetical protein
MNFFSNLFAGSDGIGDDLGELFDVERLADHSVNTAPVELREEGVVRCRHHDDHRVGLVPVLVDPPDHLETVHPRHHQVQQDQVETVLPDLLESFSSIPGRDDLMPMPPQNSPDEAADPIIIIHHEYDDRSPSHQGIAQVILPDGSRSINPSA